MNIRESVVHTLRCESEIIAELEKTVSEEQIEKVMNAFLNCKGKVILTGCQELVEGELSKYTYPKDRVPVPGQRPSRRHGRGTEG